jgi:hypothetical protein
MNAVAAGALTWCSSNFIFVHSKFFFTVNEIPNLKRIPFFTKFPFGQKLQCPSGNKFCTLNFFFFPFALQGDSIKKMSL